MGWLILGFVVLVVLFTSLIKNVEWNPKKKNFIAVVLSVLGAGISVLISGGLDSLLTADLLQSIVLVYGGSQALYNFVLNGTIVEAKLANVGSNRKKVIE